MVKHIFLDFGGCIDAPGIHTRTLFWDAFLAEGLLPATERPKFQEAYTQADQQMMATGEAKALGLNAFNRHNAWLIASALGLPRPEAEAAGDRVTALMDAYLKESREALRGLALRYPLSLISNFTGNLEPILREYSLRELFQSVTESFYAGCSKPDPRIFRAALAQQREPAEKCLYVGDNPVNDIAPARALGMKAVLIHPPGQKKECGAGGYIESLSELGALLPRLS